MCTEIDVGSASSLQAPRGAACQPGQRADGGPNTCGSNSCGEGFRISQSGSEKWDHWFSGCSTDGATRESAGFPQLTGSNQSFALELTEIGGNSSNCNFAGATPGCGGR